MVVVVGEGVQWVLGPCREMACSEAIDRSDERARGRPMLLRTMQQKKTPGSRSSDLAHEMHGKRDAVGMLERGRCVLREMEGAVL